jgi:hypothetical protein
MRPAVSTRASVSTDPEILMSRTATLSHTGNKVTIWLIALLAALIFVHYVAMFVLDWKGKKIENVSNAFNATLPVIAGLTGAAVTYYFTRRSDK